MRSAVRLNPPFPRFTPGAGPLRLKGGGQGGTPPPPPPRARSPLLQLLERRVALLLEKPHGTTPGEIA